MKKLGIDLFASELRGLQPRRLNHVLELGFRVGEVEGTADQLSQEPELHVPTLWIHQVFDVGEAAYFNSEPGFLPNLTCGSLFVALLALDAASRSDPEVVASRPNVVNYEQATVAFNDGTGGDAMGLQCEA